MPFFKLFDGSCAFRLSQLRRTAAGSIGSQVPFLPTETGEARCFCVYLFPNLDAFPSVEFHLGSIHRLIFKIGLFFFLTAGSKQVLRKFDWFISIYFMLRLVT